MVFGVVLSAAQAQDTSDKQQYCFRFEQGRNYLLKTAIERTSIRTGIGQYAERRREAAIESEFDVEEVDANGNAWVRYTYKRASLKLKGEERDVKYDSTVDKQVPPAALSMALVLDESFYLKITPQGRVEKINGLEMMLAGIKAKVATIQGKDRIMESLRRQVDEREVRKELESYMAVFPDSSVGLGKSWSSREVSMDGAGMVIEKTRRLKERRSGVTVFDVNVLVKPLETAEPERIGEMTAKWFASGGGQGTVEIDEATGQIIHSQLTQDVLEEAKVISAGAMRLPERPVSAVKTHTVLTFEMVEREQPQAAGGDEPNQPPAIPH